MKITKFLVIGVLCVSTLVGCSTTQETSSKAVDENAIATADLTPESEAPVASNETPEESETPDEPTAEPTASSEAAVTDQVTVLAGLMGKTPHDVNVALGQPATSKKVEGSELIAANYYKVDFCDEVVKVEVDFDVDGQTVNYISFALMYAEDVEASKEAFVNALTNLYGESTIERYMDVKGKQRRDWNDGALTFDLKYYEDNLALDIYPLDK